MKRCFDWILNWFTQWVKKMEIEDKIGFAIGLIIGIVIGVIVFVSSDKVPATEIDYKILENQMTAIQQNPDLLLKTNCNISINDNVITVDFENDECTMTVQYGQNFEVLSISKTDKYIFWLLAFGIAVVIGIFTYSIASVLVIAVVCLLKILWKKKFKAIESKKI